MDFYYDKYGPRVAVFIVAPKKVLRPEVLFLFLLI
jgi:hypothetical protein